MKYVKKLIICIIIVSMLLNNLCASFRSVYAAIGDDERIQITEEQSSAIINDPVDIANKGTSTTRLMNTFGGIVGLIVALFPISIYAIIDIVSIVCNEFEGVSEWCFASVENIIFGKLSLLSIDFFGLEKYESTASGYNAGNLSANNVIVENVKNWYTIMNDIAIAALVVVLAYVAVRMAISTLSQDKAKYKKMFRYWVESFVLLFLLKYVMVAVMMVNSFSLKVVDKTKDAFMDMQISKLEAELEDVKNGESNNFKTVSTVQSQLSKLKAVNTKSSFESILLKKLVFKCTSSSFGESISNTIMLCFLIYYIVKFFIIYFKRMLTLGFLIVISPLITITYSIDKLGDGEAQAFNNWIKEFLINVFIQPIHCIIYIVFIFSTLYIADKAPAIGILFFAFLSRCEKVVRKIIIPKLESDMLHLSNK